jgi:hypothetical protein
MKYEKMDADMEQRLQSIKSKEESIDEIQRRVVGFVSDMET